MIPRLALGAVLLAAAIAPAQARMVADKVDYAIGATKFQGVLVYDDAVAGKRPAVVMAPDYMGVTQYSIEQAQALAGSKYVFFVADMYGAGVRPKNPKEAGAAAGAVRKDVSMVRERLGKALDVLLAEGAKRGIVDPARTAAIGFCFGGGNALELARSGRDLKAVVTFHGDLRTTQPQDAKNIKAHVLVLHGADDPVQPEAARNAFEKEMKDGHVKDWEMVVFANTVHSFTIVSANQPGRNMYNPVAAKRAYALMYGLFDSVL
jgi:dienelactone hydrolase